MAVPPLPREDQRLRELERGEQLRAAAEGPGERVRATRRGNRKADVARNDRAEDRLGGHGSCLFRRPPVELLGIADQRLVRSGGRAPPRIDLRAQVTDAQRSQSLGGQAIRFVQERGRLGKMVCEPPGLRGGKQPLGRLRGLRREPSGALVGSRRGHIRVPLASAPAGTGEGLGGLAVRSDRGRGEVPGPPLERVLGGARGMGGGKRAVDSPSLGGRGVR